MKVELFALLCLAVITHVGSLYQAGEEFQVCLPRDPKISTPAWVLCMRWWANLESRVT